MKRFVFCAVSALCGVAAASSLEITGNYAVAAEGETYDSVTISASATITGGTLSIADSGRISVTAGEVIINNAGLVVGSTSGNTVDVSVASGAILRVPAAISGPAGIMIGHPNPGTIYFSGANDFTGILSVTGGLFHAASDQAFGSADAPTYLTSYGSSTETAVLMFDGIDTSETFSYHTDISSGTYYHFYFSEGTTNFLRGAIKRLDGRGNCNFRANSRTVFYGDLNLNYWQIKADKTALVEFRGNVDATRYIPPNGTFEYYKRVSSSISGGYGIKFDGNCVHRMYATNVFAAADDSTSAYSGAYLYATTGSGVFDLNGYDQRVRGFCEIGTLVSVTSGVPATLHCDAVPRGVTVITNSFMYRGAVSFSVEGTTPMLFNNNSSSTGVLHLAVSGANVTLNGAGHWSGDLHVASGATQTLMTASALADSSVVNVDSGGVVSIPEEISLFVREIVVDGTEYKSPGTYGSAESGADTVLDCFIGKGFFTIAASESKVCKWNVEEGTTGARVSQSANWDEMPDFALGYDAGVFSQSGSSALVDVVASFNSISLLRPAGSSFTFEDGGGMLSVGAGGLTTGTGLNPAQEEPRCFTNNAALRLYASQTWNLSTNTSFVQNGPVSMAASSVFTLGGGGNMYMNASSPECKGELVVLPDCGGLHINADNALGSATLSIRTGRTMTGGFPLVQFHGVSISNEIVRTQDSQDAMVLGFEEGTTNEFFGPVNMVIIARPEMGRKCKVVFHGGLSGLDWRSGQMPGVSMVFTNTVCSELPAFDSSVYDSAPTIIDFWTSGNKMTKHAAYSGGFNIGGYFILRTHCDNAFVPSDNSTYPAFYFKKSNGYTPSLDLCGTVQNFGALYETENYLTATGAVTSASAGQLHVWQQHPHTATLLNTVLTNVVFTGGAGLTLEEGSLTFARVPCSTTGRVEVAGGTLTLNNSWTNAAAAEVIGGTMRLGRSDVFGRNTDVYLYSDGGTLELDPDTLQQIRWLYYDGRRMPLKEYSGGEYSISGTGKLVANGDGVRMLIIFR